MRANVLPRFSKAAPSKSPQVIRPAWVGDTAKNLAEAAAGEREEWSDLYEDFAKIAQEEGFPKLPIPINWWPV